MKQYATVQLKTGETACIVEVLEDEKIYIADIEHLDGKMSTEYLTHDQIVKVLQE